MPFDLSTAIPVKLREDGLYMKDLFDLGSAVAIDEPPKETKQNWELLEDPSFKADWELLKTSTLGQLQDIYSILGAPVQWALGRKMEPLIELPKLVEQLTLPRNLTLGEDFMAEGVSGDISILDGLFLVWGGSMALKTFRGNLEYNQAIDKLIFQEKIKTVEDAVAYNISKDLPKYEKIFTEGGLFPAGVDKNTKVKVIMDGLNNNQELKTEVMADTYLRVRGIDPKSIIETTGTFVGAEPSNLFNKLKRINQLVGERGSIPLIRAKVGQKVVFEGRPGEIIKVEGQRIELQFLGEKTTAIATLGQLSLPKVEVPTEGKVSSEAIKQAKEKGIDIGGYYDPNTNEIYVKEGMPKWATDTVKFHEQTHKLFKGNPQLLKQIKTELKLKDEEKIINIMERSNHLGGSTGSMVADKLIYEPESIKLSTPIGQKPPIEPPKTAVSGKPTPEEPDAVKKVIQALKEAKSVRSRQETLYAQERAKRFAKAQAIGEKIKGEKGFYAELGQLKGELPKVEFESIRSKLTQKDIDSLFVMTQESPNISFLDKLSAREGLVKLFGEIGGKVPTEKEIVLLHKVFGKEFTEALMQKRSLLEKMKEAGLQLANMPRSFMSSFLDLSFGFRQGMFTVARYRKEFFSSFAKQFKWFASEQAFRENQKLISKNPNYQLAIESEIKFTEMDSMMSQGEERDASQWAEKVPLIGRVVRATSRAYTAYANRLRMDIFDRLVKQAEGMNLNPQENRDLSKAIANFVNNATGRGSLGQLERAALGLNAFFFSPRLMASRLNLLNPITYIKQEPFVRKESLKALLSFLGLGATILIMAKLAGLEVGTDPRSSDVGKIRIGKTRIDVWGGFQQYIRMAWQLISGQYVSSVTGKVITLGEGYKPLTRLDILVRQIESKEAPIFSFVTEMLKGQDFEGKPLNIPKEIGLRFVPMVMQDFYDLIKEDPTLLPVGILGIFGFGVQTYETQKRGSLLGRSSLLKSRGSLVK